MSNLLAMQSHSTSGLQQPVIINIPGFSSAPLGGVLGRESKVNQTLNYKSANYTCKFKDGIYTLVSRPAAGNTSKVYKFYEDLPSYKVRKIKLTGNPTGGTVTAGQTATGGTSGATGVVLEAYVTGDLFVILGNCSVADFVASETVSFSGGASATTTSSGFLESNGGEHGKVYTSTATNTSVSFSCSGLFPYTHGDGSARLAYVMISSSGSMSLMRTSDGVTWSESVIGSVGNPSTGGMTSCFCAGKIYTASGNASNQVIICCVDPAEASFVTAVVIGTSGATIQQLFSHRNRVFLCSTDSYAIFYTHEVTGGASSLIHSTSALISGETVFSGENEDAFYTGSVNAGVLALFRFVNISGTYQYNGSTTSDIGSKILPASLRSGLSYAWGAGYEDSSDGTATPTGRLLLHLSAVNYGNSNTVKDYEISDAWQPLVSSALVNWSGTIGNTNDVIFPSPHGLAVNDWIKHETSDKAYRIDVVTSSTQVQLANDGAPFSTPNTTSITSLAVAGITDSGGSSTGTCLPVDMRSGGSRLFTSQETSVQIVDYEAGGTANSEKIYFRVYGSGPDIEVTIHYLDIATGVSSNPTLSSPSTGSISANYMTPITPDAGATLFYVTCGGLSSGIKERRAIGETI